MVLDQHGVLIVPQNIKEGIEGKPVDWYHDVFDIVFRGLDKERTNSLWKKELAKPAKDDEQHETDPDAEADNVNPAV